MRTNKVNLHFNEQRKQRAHINVKINGRLVQKNIRMTFISSSKLDRGGKSFNYSLLSLL